jgi:hypothetical protein
MLSAESDALRGKWKAPTEHKCSTSTITESKSTNVQAKYSAGQKFVTNGWQKEHKCS